MSDRDLAAAALASANERAVRWRQRYEAAQRLVKEQGAAIEVLRKQRTYWRDAARSEVGNFFQTVGTDGAERRWAALDEREPKP